jgi:hypothetical protein
MPSPYDTSDFGFHRTLSASFIRFPGDDAPPFIYTPPPPPEPRATVPDARLRRLARHLHLLGERPLYELLREVLAGRDPVASLEAYGRLDPDILEALGADRLPRLRTVQ